MFHDRLERGARGLLQQGQRQLERGFGVLPFLDVGYEEIETDWERFEREFRAYVEERELVRA